ncbi:MAG: YciI-like protein [Cyclobacterium sp.]|uniref:YciI-like protein n=1 Tax=unclassified Cyclobacterium TaxID=2615055 RepID=UPI0013D1EB32|nr:YciI-like protein [Cyclobacterium sp. SYSU L10401]
MNHYLLTYEVAEDYVEKRIPFRKAHLSLAENYFRKGLLIMGGALAHPADTAVLVFRCEEVKTVEDFVKQDPYWQNGLVKSWKIREWTVVVGVN